jgi:hypothetical protein
MGMFRRIWTDGHVAEGRYPHVGVAVTARKLKPEDRVSALYWLALVDHGVRNSCYGLMVRATRATGFLLVDDEGAARARAYVESRLGTDAAAKLDSALLDGERCDWREIAALLSAFWAAMLVHGKHNNEYADYGIGAPDYRFAGVKPVDLFREYTKDQDLYDWK